jgi:hypothetical protein
MKVKQHQVAALPVRYSAAGFLEVRIIYLPRNRSFHHPKGWPMKGRSDADASAQEALEKAGAEGKIGRKPIGSYTYWERLSNHFE